LVKKVKDNQGKRSDCPVSCTLELIGDKWSLLIIRDLMFFNKTTYNEFLDSSEKISTNILNDRLVMLREMGLIEYKGLAKRKKYYLTDKGLDLKPVLEAVGNFGMKHFKGSREYVEKKMRNVNAHKRS
jgi:DNA-binding HxlR family transcriptional regulator